jgi:predicted anti-sigma-YlaC factor YlaD
VGNFAVPTSDLNDMDCPTWREALSAMLDSEAPGVDESLVEAHLRRCPGCREFHATSLAIRQHAVGASESADIAPAVVKAHVHAERFAGWSIPRALLAVVAVQIMVFAFPALVLGDEANTAAHEARHLGAFTAAYGLALLVVVLRPSRARALLPVAGFIAGALAITSIVDLSRGRIPLSGEWVHLPEIFSVVLVWLLAVPAPRRRSRSSALPTSSAASLRIVKPDDRQVS